MKKIIAYSLWGDGRIYNYGALENALVAEEFYPDWICRFYCANNCDPVIIKELEKRNNVEVVKVDCNENKAINMFWRFIPAFEDDVDVMISRDTDSILSMREKRAVDEWLNTPDKDFHIMRDHPEGHSLKIMGGMWGCRNGIIKHLKSEFEEFMEVHKNKGRSIDQTFLVNKVYPTVVNKAVIHAQYFKFEGTDVCKDFPDGLDFSEAGYGLRGYIGEINHHTVKACNLLKEREGWHERHPLY